VNDQGTQHAQHAQHAQPGKIRVAIIGCGGNMAGHVKRLVEHLAAEVEIVALVDPAAASIDRLADRSPAVAGVPRFESHAPVLARGRPDAGELGTPHALHHRHLTDALGAGAHVLAEKPMVCEVEEAHGVRGRGSPWCARSSTPCG
jgi:predicted dehydrogenase